MKNLPLFELKKLQSSFPCVKISHSDDAADFIRQFFGDDIEIFESCFILLLNQANKTIGYAKISQGGITGTVVDVRIIAKFAVESLACNVIVAHNHPSGNLNPSGSDIAMTQCVKDGLSLLQIQLRDHVILTKDSFYSFADNGQL